MAAKVVAIFLAKFVLINIVFLSYFCESFDGDELYLKEPMALLRSRRAVKGNKGGGGGKATSHSSCYCETMENLCDFSGGIDIRISTEPDKGKVCAPGLFNYCDMEFGDQEQTCGLRRISPAGAVKPDLELFGQYPWHVGLYQVKTNAYLGSGVLITAQHVLTAAHKVAPLAPGKFHVRLGEWHRKVKSCNAQQIGVSKMRIHPKFKLDGLLNDIAVLKLSESVHFERHPTINTACLADSVPKNGTRCWVSGWGEAHYGQGDYSNELKDVELPFIDHDTCDEELKKTRLGHDYEIDRKSFICAGGEVGKDACTGDGGAPLVCETSTGQFQVIGLVAWGVGCASTKPSAYVNVPNYRTWILDQIFNTSC